MLTKKYLRYSGAIDYLIFLCSNYFIFTNMPYQTNRYYCMYIGKRMWKRQRSSAYIRQSENAIGTASKHYYYRLQSIDYTEWCCNLKSTIPCCTRF